MIQVKSGLLGNIRSKISPKDKQVTLIEELYFSCINVCINICEIVRVFDGQSAMHVTLNPISVGGGVLVIIPLNVN